VHGSFCADPEAGTCHAMHKAIQHADETLRLHMLDVLHVVAANCAGLEPLALQSSVCSVWGTTSRVSYITIINFLPLPPRVVTSQKSLLCILLHGVVVVAINKQTKQERQLTICRIIM